MFVEIHRKYGENYTIWVNVFHIANFTKNERGTEITLKDGKIIETDMTPQEIINQVNNNMLIIEQMVLNNLLKGSLSFFH